MPLRPAALALACLLLTACWGGGSSIAPDNYSGPPIRLDQLEGRHLLVVSAPTPGWRITIDRTERRLDDTLVFVTLRRPDPGMVYAQVVVEQEVLTPVPGTREVVVYARTTDFGRRDHRPPYHPVRAGATLED